MTSEKTDQIYVDKDADLKESFCTLARMLLPDDIHTRSMIIMSYSITPTYDQVDGKLITNGYLIHAACIGSD